MSITNVTLNGNVYVLMENNVKRPKAAERWIAICPMKGDSKWFAKTKEDLVARIEEEEGGVKATAFKPKKVSLWSSEEVYNGKPIVQWFTDGTMDVDTPTARFRIEMAPARKRGVVVPHILPVPNEDYNSFCQDLLEMNNAGYFRGVLTKIRLKNPDGSTLRDIDGLSITEEDSDVTPMSLLDKYVEDILEEEGNDLVSFVHAFREDADSDDAFHILNTFSKQEVDEAKAVFLVIDAMKFIDANCDDVAESSGNSHHQNSNLSSEDARGVLATVQSVATALSSIL